MTEVTVPDAVESYLTERSSELPDSSIQNHRYQLKQFRQWYHGAGDVDSIGKLNPIDLSRFRDLRLGTLVTLCNDCHWTLHRKASDIEGDRLDPSMIGEPRQLRSPTFRNSWVELNESQQAVLDKLADAGDPLRLNTIIERTELSRHQVTDALDSLRIAGLAKRVSRGTYAYVTEHEVRRNREYPDRA